MPASFERLGIAFQYPENWDLDEQDALLGEQSVAVYSPGGAFWCVAMQPAGVEPKAAAEAALAALRKEYELDAEDAHETIGQRELVGYDVNFYYVDLTNTAYIRAFGTPGATYLVLCQAEDRDLPAVEPLFRAMTASLIQSLA